MLHERYPKVLYWAHSYILRMGLLLYVNDLPGVMNCHSTLFADDTTFCCSNYNEDLLNADIKYTKIISSNWFLQNELGLNNDKTVDMTFSLNINNEAISSTKFLGIHVDSKLSWDTHIRKLCSTLLVGRVLEFSCVEAA